MIRTFKTLLVTLMVAASMAGQSFAQTKSKIDPKAAEILKQVTTYLGTAKTLSFTAITMYDVLSKSGIKTLRVVKQDIVLQRPRGLYSRFEDERGTTREMWFDGTSVTVFQVNKNIFDVAAMKLSAKATNDDFLDALSARLGVSFPIIDLLYSNIARNVRENLISGVYLGKRNMILDGTRAHHISFESQNADWQIWVAVGDKPVILRMAVTYVTQAERPGYVTIMGNWKVNSEVQASLFTPNVPKGARRQKFLKK